MSNRLDDDGARWDLSDDAVDALALTGWLAVRDVTPTPIVPARASWSGLGDWQWAHDNDAAWLLVDLPDGLTVEEAWSLMAAAAHRSAA